MFTAKVFEPQTFPQFRIFFSGTFLYIAKFLTVNQSVSETTIEIGISQLIFQIKGSITCGHI